MVCRFARLHASVARTLMVLFFVSSVLTIPNLRDSYSVVQWPNRWPKPFEQFLFKFWFSLQNKHFYQRNKKLCNFISRYFGCIIGVWYPFYLWDFELRYFPINERSNLRVQQVDSDHPKEWLLGCGAWLSSSAPVDAFLLFFYRLSSCIVALFFDTWMDISELKPLFYFTYIASLHFLVPQPFTFMLRYSSLFFSFHRLLITSSLDSYIFSLGFQQVMGPTYGYWTIILTIRVTSWPGQPRLSVPRITTCLHRIVILVTRLCCHFLVVIPVIIILTFVSLVLTSLHLYLHCCAHHLSLSYLVFTHHVYN